MTNKTSKKNKHKITDPALRRLLQRAGVKRVSHSIYGELRNVMKDFTTELIAKTITFTENDGRKTIKIEDVESALEVGGYYLAAAVNPNSHKSIKSCGSVPHPPPKTELAESKTRKYKPGVRAQKAIKYQQKHSDCLAIPKANFEDFVRKIAATISDGLRFAEKVFVILQIIVESYITNVCFAGYELDIHAKRQSLLEDDVILAIIINKMKF